MAKKKPDPKQTEWVAPDPVGSDRPGPAPVEAVQKFDSAPPASPFAQCHVEKIRTTFYGEAEPLPGGEWRTRHMPGGWNIWRPCSANENWLEMYRHES